MWAVKVLHMWHFPRFCTIYTILKKYGRTLTGSDWKKTSCKIDLCLWYHAIINDKFYDTTTKVLGACLDYRFLEDCFFNCSNLTNSALHLWGRLTWQRKSSFLSHTIFFLFKTEQITIFLRFCFLSSVRNRWSFSSSIYKWKNLGIFSSFHKSIFHSKTVTKYFFKLHFFMF